MTEQPDCQIEEQKPLFILAIYFIGGGVMRKKKEISKDYLYNQYIENRLTMTQIGKRLGVSRETIANRLREYNIPIFFTKVDISKNYLYNRYIKDKLSSIEIAKLLGISKPIILSRLKEYGIPSRSPAEARKARTLKGFHGNRWNGGRIVYGSGYVDIWIRSNDPFHSMIRNDWGCGGYIREHRLVMAKHLKRPLESWEQIHHKGMKYPLGSREDKQDNRIENLELIENLGHSCFHRQITLLKEEVKELRGLLLLVLLSKKVTIK